MKYYIIAGEASGDLHGSKLIEGIKKNDPQAGFRFWGGDKMAREGGEENLVKHYKESSFMGFTEVLKNLPAILSQISECKKDLLAYAPDVVILIDYAGFNLRIAKFAKARGMKTFYYIAPKVWAWKESRVKKLRKYADELFVIFPFEVEYFRKWGIEAHYCGNPIMDSIEERTGVGMTFEQFAAANDLENKPVIALLAGSRRHEIDYNLPFMVDVSRRFPDYQFVVAGVSWLDKPLYDAYIKNSGVKYVCDKTYELLSHSTAAIVTSGTATLETALLNVPELVCFWCNRLTVWIVSSMSNISYISLVNIILDREAVKELIHKDMTRENAVRELKAILPAGEKHDRLMMDYAELREKIGGSGSSERTAAKMVELLCKN